MMKKAEFFKKFIFIVIWQFFFPLKCLLVQTVVMQKKKRNLIVGIEL